MATSRRRQGFTLVELLVVMGIIAVLMAILLPVLAQARDKAQAIACANNLREIYLAMSQYASQHRTYPSASDPAYGKIGLFGDASFKVDKTWSNMLVERNFLPGGADPQAARPGPLVCPSVDPALYDRQHVLYAPLYAYNYYVFPPLWQLEGSKYLPDRSFYGRRSRMARNSTCMVMLSEIWSMASFADGEDPSRNRKWRERWGSHIFTGVGWDGWGGPEVDLRHSRGRAANVVFFAGNVELVCPRPPPYAPSRDDLFEDHPFAISRFIRTDH